MSLRVSGWKIISTPMLKIPPGEIGRRIVRTGMADILRWLGEEPGPAPTDTQAWIDNESAIIYVDPEVFKKLNRYVELGFPVNVPNLKFSKPYLQEAYEHKNVDGAPDVFSI